MATQIDRNSGQDRILGIGIMILFGIALVVSLYFLCIGLLTQGRNSSEVGGLLFVGGVMGLALSIPWITVGYGIMKSRRWAFMCCIVLFLITGFGGAAGLHRLLGLPWLIVSIFTVVYCVQRLSGKKGTPPL